MNEKKEARKKDKEKEKVKEKANVKGIMTEEELKKKRDKKTRTALSVFVFLLAFRGDFAHNVDRFRLKIIEACHSCHGSSFFV